MDLKKDLRNIVEDITGWTFCMSTLSFTLILISWVLYSINLIALESAAKIILLLLVAFVGIQLFSRDENVHSIRSFCESITGEQLSTKK